MNRKNTILLAVLINAGLLVVLFITALTTQDELSIPPSHEMGVAPKSMEENTVPLFEEVDLAVKQPTVAPLPQVVHEPTPTNAKQSEPAVIHTLPPLVPEAHPPTAAPVTPAAPAVKVESSSQLEVTVKKGDTLDKIAKANKTTVDEIIKLNQLPSNFLRVGQKLKMPAPKTVSAQKIAAVKAPEKKSVESGPDYYTVKVGDNPWTIAMKHHLKVDELLKLNGLNEEKARKLKPGDRLRIK